MEYCGILIRNLLLFYYVCGTLFGKIIESSDLLELKLKYTNLVITHKPDVYKRQHTDTFRKTTFFMF